jgi:hypothetical protein
VKKDKEKVRGCGKFNPMWLERGKCGKKIMWKSAICGKYDG